MPAQLQAGLWLRRQDVPQRMPPRVCRLRDQVREKSGQGVQRSLPGAQR